MSHRRQLSRIVCSIVLAAICFSVALPVGAESRKKKQEAADKQFVIRDKRVSKKFEKLRELLDAERMDEAKQLLDSFNLKKLKPYPRALVNQTQAFVAGNSDDYESAAHRGSLACRF